MLAFDMGKLNSFYWGNYQTGVRVRLCERFCLN